MKKEKKHIIKIIEKENIIKIMNEKKKEHY